MKEILFIGEAFVNFLPTKEKKRKLNSPFIVGSAFFMQSVSQFSCHSKSCRRVDLSLLLLTLVLQFAESCCTSEEHGNILTFCLYVSWIQTVEWASGIAKHNRRHLVRWMIYSLSR